MVTVEKIKLLLPDDVLAALTDDQNTGQINEQLIQEVINDGYAFINAKASSASEAVQDEFVINYVLFKLYSYAGQDEKAYKYLQIYQGLLDSVQDGKLASVIETSSQPRAFTDEELGRW